MDSTESATSKNYDLQESEEEPFNKVSDKEENGRHVQSHQELALVLEMHRHKLQQYLTPWTQEQGRILIRCQAGHSEAVLAGPTTSLQSNELRMDDLPPPSIISLRASNTSLRASNVRSTTTTISEESNTVRASVRGPVMGKRSSLDSMKSAISGTRARLRSVNFDPKSSDSSNAESPKDKFDQINAQLQRLNFQRRSNSKKSIIARPSILSAEDQSEDDSCRFRRMITLVVQSSKFDSLCSVVILLNAIVMGISADYAIRHPHDPDITQLEFLEQVFCLWYAFEVCLRIFVYGCDYFCGHGWSWNLFDVALVVQSLYDQIQTILAAGELRNNFSFLRMLRLMKMLRLLRIIRLMKMFKELRMMLFSMLGSMKAMVWACVFIAMISYMFGICVLQGCTLYLQGGGTDSLVVDLIDLYWGSIGGAMLSLFKSSTAGINWNDIAKHLEEVGVFFYALFVLYVAFFAFVVVNTLTSIFVEVTMENSEKDNQMVIQLELEKKNMYMNRLQAFYDEINNDENGCISYEDFCQHLQNPKMMAFAASLDLDILNAKQFFFMLSENGEKPVDVETFVVGCIKLKGLAKNMDLMDLIYSFKKAQTDQKEHAADIQRRLDGMKGILSDARLAKRLDSIEAALSLLEKRLGGGQLGIGRAPHRGEQPLKDLLLKKDVEKL